GGQETASAAAPGLCIAEETDLSNHLVVGQSEADRDGQIDLLHHILLHMAHLFPQALFVQGAHLLQQDHRIPAQAAAVVHGKVDMCRQLGLPGLGSDGRRDHSGTVPVAGVVLNDQNRPDTALLTAHHRGEIGIVNIA
ncbi:Acyl-coenzyme A thioesterase PaaI, partial [Dysosmobacter welbionis]